ncbi:hypothetical protein NP493_285g02048 [Ridgeia piscesae]|uniref:Uncharacterized protein n=1 Tax=Ridgeia piscesae TaxID=27915 RepID=A0AAD9NX20_RIDPI|nr:hypothetical protein NP493_285g02048 [Ridgeia piscesae]
MTIAAVALCVGFLLVCFGLCCMRRKRDKRKTNGKPNPNGRANGTVVQGAPGTGTGTGTCNLGSLPPPPPFLMKHEYAYISDMPPPPPPSPSPPIIKKGPSYVHFSGESPAVCPSGKRRDNNDNACASLSPTVHRGRFSPPQNDGVSYDLVASGTSGSSNVVVSPLRGDQPFRTGPRTATISIGRPREPLASSTRNGYGTLNKHRGPCTSPKYGYSPKYFQVDPDLMAGMYSVRQGRCLPPPDELPALAQETHPVNFNSKNVTL